MQQYDLHDNVKQKEVIAIQTVGTTGTGRTGKVIDRSGYAGVEFLVGYGSITATNAVFTAVMKEGDVTGTLTTVSAANMLGSMTGAGVGQAATRTSGVSKNVTKRVGYIGTKRYVSINLSSTVTAGASIHVVAVLGSPQSIPQAT